MLNPKREMARKLRMSGYSYHFIEKKLKVPRSTLCYWIRDINYQPNQESKNDLIAAHNRGKRTKRLNKIKKLKQIENNSMAEMRSIDDINSFKFGFGLGLYWGEGKKYGYNVSMTNSNPNLLKFFIKWLSSYFEIGKNSIRIQLHLYPDIDKEKAADYWSKKLLIPKKNFYKPNIDSREKKLIKKGKLPYGTAHIYLLDSKVKTQDVYWKIIYLIKAAEKISGSSSMAERLPSKQDMRVRFPFSRSTRP